MKRKFKPVPAVVAVGLAAACLAQLNPGVEPMQDLVLGKEAGYALWPEEFVAEGSLDDASWSASGRYVLGIRRPRPKLTDELVRDRLLNPGGHEPEPARGIPLPLPGAAVESEAVGTLFLWSAVDRTVVDLRRVSEMQSVGVQWMPEGDFAVVTGESVVKSVDGYSTGLHEVLLVDARKGTMRSLFKATGTPEVQVSISADGLIAGGYAVILVGETRNGDTASPQTRTVARLIDKNGVLKSPIELPTTERGYIVLGSRSTGRSYLLGMVGREARAKGESPRFLIDPVKNRVVPCTKADSADAVSAYDFQLAADSELSVRIDQTKIGSGASARSLSLAWLESDAKPENKSFPTEALVAADCRAAKVSRTCNGVLFERVGGIYFRRIQKLSLSDFESVAETRERTEVMNKAKMVGLGVIMYSVDCDDEFPTPDGFNDKIMPYVKDAGLLEGFVYTLAGGNMSQMENPSETEMGYVDGKNGRAVVYADGHVRWIKNK